MFVGDEQYKQCALVVLGKGDLVDAKKDLCQHQSVKIYVSTWTQGQFQLLCTRFVGSALNLSQCGVTCRHRMAPKASDRRLQRGARQKRSASGPGQTSYMVMVASSMQKWANKC